jgi:secreted PhoX family phosphatase
VDKQGTTTIPWEEYTQRGVGSQEKVWDKDTKRQAIIQPDGLLILQETSVWGQLDVGSPQNQLVNASSDPQGFWLN